MGDSKRIVDDLLKELVAFGDIVEDIEKIYFYDLSKLILAVLENDIKLNPFMLALVDEYVDKLVTQYTDNITSDFKMLSLWYMLSRLQGKESIQSLDELFFTIYLNISDTDSIFKNIYGMEFFVSGKNFKEYIDNIFLYNQGPIDKVFIYKLYYITYMCFERGEYYLYLNEKLKEIYKQAIDSDLEELVFYLYFPLLMTDIGIRNSQADFRNFNDEIEKSLENFILEKIIPKYEIKPNSAENNNKKIAFLIERAVPTSIYNVTDSLLENLSKIENLDYEIYILDLNVYELNGSDPKYVERLKSFNVKYVNLKEVLSVPFSFTYDLVQHCLDIRRFIINEKINTLIAVNGRVEISFLFSCRTAPNQIYWSHGNFEYDVNNIDKKITNCFIENKNKYHFERTGMIAKIHSSLTVEEQKAVESIRKQYPKDSYVLGTIGRLLKIDNDEYINTIANIMKKNTHCIYLACGVGDINSVKDKFKKHGLEERVYMPGFVNAKYYGHVIDLVLDSFPIEGGNTIRELISKKKMVIRKSMEEMKVFYILDYWEEYYNAKDHSCEKVKYFFNEFINYLSDEKLTVYDKKFVQEYFENFKGYKVFKNYFEEYEYLADLCINDSHFFNSINKVVQGVYTAQEKLEKKYVPLEFLQLVYNKRS